MMLANHDVYEQVDPQWRATSYSSERALSDRPIRDTFDEALSYAVTKRQYHQEGTSGNPRLVMFTYSTFAVDIVREVDVGALRWPLNALRVKLCVEVRLRTRAPSLSEVLRKCGGTKHNMPGASERR